MTKCTLVKTALFALSKVASHAVFLQQKLVSSSHLQQERRAELVRLESENADSRFVVDPQRGPQVRANETVLI